MYLLGKKECDKGMHSSTILQIRHLLCDPKTMLRTSPHTLLYYTHTQK